MHKSKKVMNNIYSTWALDYLNLFNTFEILNVIYLFSIFIYFAFIFSFTSSSSFFVFIFILRRKKIIRNFSQLLVCDLKCFSRQLMLLCPLLLFTIYGKVNKILSDILKFVAKIWLRKCSERIIKNFILKRQVFSITGIVVCHLW